jgi:hypothetical protein
MKTLTKVILVVNFLLFTLNCSLSTLNAAVPHLINYQGRLTDSTGKPLEGTHNLTFRIYDAETAGNLLWEETQSVLLQKGVFSVLLGGVTNLDLPFDKPYWLEIKVNNEVMSPRQRIASAGYAIRAEKAEDAMQAQNADKVNQFTAIPANDTSIGTISAYQKLVALDENGKLPPEALPMFASDNNFIFSVSASKSSNNKSGTYTFSSSVNWTEVWSDEIYIGKGVNSLKMNCDVYGYGNTWVRFRIGSQYSDEQECHDNNWAGRTATMSNPPKGKQKVYLQVKFSQAGDQPWGSGGVRNAYLYIP